MNRVSINMQSMRTYRMEFIICLLFKQKKQESQVKLNSNYIQLYYFIMDGKQGIKIMNKIQLLTSLKHGLSQGDLRFKHSRKITMKKRGSTPLISTSISVQKKNNNHSSTIKRLPVNNFMLGNNHTFAVAGCQRMIQCHTAMTRKTYKKQQPIQKTESQKLLLKHSDKVQKLIWNQADQSLSPLIISADFVMDQDSFWSVPTVNPSVSKTWKSLHRNYYVIWIVKMQKGFKKLKDFSEANQLPLNAAYYHRRQTKYTVDFTPIRKQLSKVYGSSLSSIILIENLRLNPKDGIQFNSFLGKIPLMLDSRLKVCYIRSQENGLGFQNVYDACKNLTQIPSQKIKQLHYIKNFVHTYLRNLERDYSEINNLQSALSLRANIENQFIDEDEVQKQVQNFRRQLVENVIKQNGRNFQFQGFSVHYFVGDIIKRNYNLLLDSATKRMKQKQVKITKLNKVPQSKFQTLQLKIMETFYQYYI